MTEYAIKKDFKSKSFPVKMKHTNKVIAEFVRKLEDAHKNAANSKLKFYDR